MDSSTIASRPIIASAASQAAPSYSASSRRRTRGRLLLVGVDQFAAFGAGLVEPLLEHRLADLLHVGLELGRRCDDRHAVGLELVERVGVHLAALGPAARLGVGGGLQHGVL